MGHVISKGSIAVDLKKVEAISRWPLPSNPKEMRGFSGLTGYYRKFIRDYEGIAAPLNNMLKKGSFKWDDKLKLAFDTLKRAVQCPPVLAMPNFNKDFVIECNASGGVGALLMQDNHPITFSSQGLRGKALLLSTYEKEILAILLAVKKWRQYLLGRRFITKTDQRSIKFLLDQRICQESQHPWLQKLAGYDYLIEYKRGTENQATDALSRRHEEEGVVQVDGRSMTIVLPSWFDAVKEMVKISNYFKELKKKIEEGQVQQDTTRRWMEFGFTKTECYSTLRQICARL